MPMTAEQIKTEIGRFWNLFTSKSAEGMEELYAHEASVFGSAATRSEPGRLAATRRKRQYFHPQTNMTITLGPIEVLVLGEAAVASYTFKLHASKVAGAMGKHVEEMRGTILKLRALEAKMEALKSKDDAAFRAASLEHAKLLTDLQDSHLKHMEGMMGGK